MTGSHPPTMRQWVLARRPDGPAVHEDFRLERIPVALIGLFEGTNAGVRIVRVAADAERRSAP